jgi:hypothetical protein
MKGESMNKEHSKKSFFSSPRFLSLIWGIILMTLSVIAATGKTPGRRFP